MDFRGLRNHIRLVSGRLCGRRQRGKESKGNADGGIIQREGVREKGVGVTHTQGRAGEGMRGGQRQRETVEEMAGGKRVQKCNSGLYTEEKTRGSNKREITPLFTVNV